ncbi:MAG: PKD domain-containing protein [Bacteroidia bacterium]
MKCKAGFILWIAIIGNSFVYSQLSWKPKPVAGFKMIGDTLRCLNKVKLTDTSKISNPCNVSNDSCDSIIDWDWDFGYGKKSKLQNPVHIYTQNGYFTITLKITSKYGLRDSASMVIYSAGPRPEFKVVSDTIIEVGDTVIFQNTSLDPLYLPEWIWNFGDGFMKSEMAKMNSGHRYSTIGKFEVYLTMFDMVNGMYPKCPAIYPDTTSALSKKITITVIKSGKISNHNTTKISVSPNPANDQIFIKGLTKGEILIYDVLGKEVLKTEMENDLSIDISSLNKGTYFIRCSDGNSSYNGRFVKIL